MKQYQQQLINTATHIKSSIIETVKVLSSMVLVFLVLALVGPLTHAVQQIDRLF